MTHDNERPAPPDETPEPTDPPPDETPDDDESAEEGEGA